MFQQAQARHGAHDLHQRHFDPVLQFCVPNLKGQTDGRISLRTLIRFSKKSGALNLPPYARPRLSCTYMSISRPVYNMKGFEGILAIDAGKQLAIFLCSGTITDFIYSPFDTPKGPDGVIFSSKGR
jgi:hypothetical protein